MPKLRKFKIQLIRLARRKKRKMSRLKRRKSRLLTTKMRLKSSKRSSFNSTKGFL